MSKRRATEVNVARSRLKGALQEIEGNQNDDDDLDSSKPSRGRPPKRVKKELSPQPQQTVHHTFIMKLFDRSVDLGKYTQHTALYPICRAWMLNQPRSNSIANYKTKREPTVVKREPNDELLDDIKEERISDVTELPPSKSVGIKRIPSPLPFQKNNNIIADVDNAFDEPLTSMTRDDLLIGWKDRWTQVRKKWEEHTQQETEKKHGQNMKILEALYKK